MKNIYKKEKNDQENRKMTIKQPQTNHKPAIHRPKSTKMLRFTRKLTRKRLDYIIKSRE